MRGSAWIVAAAGAVIWLLAVAWPAAAPIGAVLGEPRSDVDVASPWSLIVTSVSWSLAVAMGAMIVGRVPGRVLGAALHRGRFAPLAAACLLPICLPAYMVFYAWWQSWPAGSALFRWAVENDLVPLFRRLTLYVSLVCWSWPVVAWTVAAASAVAGRRHEEMRRLDGAPWWRLAAGRLRDEGRELLLGGGLVFLLVMGNTTCFDLAEVFTIGNELRSVKARGGTTTDLLVAAAPALLVAAIGAAAIWAVLPGASAPPADRPRPAGRRAWAVTVATLVITFAVPWTLFAVGLVGAPREGGFLLVYGRGLANTLLLAAGSAVLVAVVAVGLALAWDDRRAWVRRLAHVQAVGWLVFALVPAMVVAAALEAAWNLPVPIWETSGNDGGPLGLGAAQSEITIAELMYRRPVILLLGHLARFGFVGALFGRWLSRRQPRWWGELRRLDGAETLRGLVGSTWPRLLAAGVATMAIVFVLSMGEIILAAQLRPPGFDLIASSILNDIHYQRPREVMFAALVFAAVGVIVALIVPVLRAPRRLRGGAGVVVLAAALLLPGCSGGDGAGAARLDPVLAFGAAGEALGQFNYPRGIAVDPARELLYIVDKSARVQRFGLDGLPQHQWRMPARELGKPTGLNVGPDGTVYVADTHYFRIMAFDPEGRELLRFGRYGEAPAEFIYPTDVAFGPEGRLYVSEYGGNDRVQVFTGEGEYLFGFGAFGEGPGQLSRPQSMMFTPDRRELYVADSCNHRIVVYDATGQVLRSFGEAGRGAGQLLYPYDLAVLPDGSIIVCEFGNARLQRFAADGRSLGVRGEIGAGDGQLQYPWGVDATDDRIYVLDSGNNRVQVVGMR